MAESGAFRRGGLYGSYDIVDKGLFRDKGKLTAVSGELGRINEKLAGDLQEQVAQALRQKLVRPGTSSGMLERALRAKGNRQSGYSGFAVGIVKFLDDQGPQWKGGSAHVWEQIEKGTAVHEGQVLRGLWADEINPRGASYMTKVLNSQRDIIGDAHPMGNRGMRQGFRPFTRYGARQALKKANRSGRFVGVIRNPIEAENYFARGWKAFGGMSTIESAYDQMFARLGIRVRWVNGRVYRV